MCYVCEERKRWPDYERIKGLKDPKNTQLRKVGALNYYKWLFIILWYASGAMVWTCSSFYFISHKSLYYPWVIFIYVIIGFSNYFKERVITYGIATPLMYGPILSKALTSKYVFYESSVFHLQVCTPKALIFFVILAEFFCPFLCFCRCHLA